MSYIHNLSTTKILIILILTHGLTFAYGAILWQYYLLQNDHLTGNAASNIPWQGKDGHLILAMGGITFSAMIISLLIVYIFIKKDNT